MIHILHLDQDVKRAYVISNLLIQRGWDFEFVGGKPTGIVEAYIEIETTALEDGWDHEDIVMQDDVSIDPNYFDELHEGADLMIYGKQLPSGHICPKAYSATAAGHMELLDELRVNQEAPNGRRSVCPAFMAVADRIGVVANVTTNIFFAPRVINAEV